MQSDSTGRPVAGSGPLVNAPARRAASLVRESALLALLVALVYAGVLRHPFVRLDDHPYITGNPVLQRGLTLEGARWAFTTAHEANWHPLTWISHLLDVSLFGMRAGGHHLTGLLLHAANAVLLFHVLARMTGATRRSLLVAALFAVHPLHVESVAWAAERKDLLSAFFSILALAAHARHAARPRAMSSLPVAAALAAALMAKPMAVTLPFVLLLLDLWPLGRWQRLPVARLVAEKLPLFALTLGSIAATLAAQGGGGATVPLDVIPMVPRIANALSAVAAYLAKTLWPAALSVFYPHPWYTGGIPPTDVLAAGLAVAIVSTLAAVWRRRSPYLAVGWLLFLGMLVPVSGLVQVGGQGMADRYTYLPLIGLFIVLSWGTADMVAGWRAGRVAAALLWLAATASLAVAARAQLTTWRSDDALLSHALEVSPSWLAHQNLGEVREEQGRTDEAVAHYRAAIALAPGYTEARHRLADILARRGSDEDAARELQAALRARPADGLALYKLGGIRFRQGREGEAIACFRKAVELMPEHAPSYSNLGYALLRRGETAEGIARLREALRLDPTDPIALQQLAGAAGTHGSGPHPQH